MMWATRWVIAALRHLGRSPALSLPVFSLGFGVGVLLPQAWPMLPVPTWPLLLLALALLFYRSVPALRPLAPIALGVAWAWLHAYGQLQSDLNPALEGRDLILVGQVADLPEMHAGRLRFVLDVTSAQDGPVRTGFTGRVRLTWYQNPPPLEAGEQWQLRVRLKARHGFANPGGFDYEGWLFHAGVGATGYVRDAPNNHRIAPSGLGIQPLRQHLRERLLTLLPQQWDPGAGVIVALILGDRSAIGAPQWQALMRTGTNHLVAISGLHVGIVGGLGFFLMRLLWRRSEVLCRWFAAPRAAALAALLLAWGYAALAGFAVSTLRALVMLMVLLGAVLLRRPLQPAGSLLVALLLVLLVDPLACLSFGFWLSFGAVTVLLYGMGGRLAVSGPLWTLGRTQWLVSLGLLPVLALLFGRVSLIAPLTNLVALPLFSFLLLPLVLVAATVSLATDWVVPLHLVAWVLGQALAGLEYLGAYPWVSLSLPNPPFWVAVCAFPGVALLLAPRGLPGRWTGAFLLLPMLLWRPPLLAPGAFRFTLLDVGQGLAALVQTRDHCLVYDTGPAFPSGFNTGEAVLAPALRSRGIDRIDRLVVSHADQDHAGGLRGLLTQIPVMELLSGEPAALPAGGARQCEAGQTWIWDGVRFAILHPSSPWPVNSNDRSCVLRVEGAGGALLLTGDLERAAEQALAARLGEGLRSRVLVAGHHGSNSSSSAELLAIVRPQWVLFSEGYRNRFGFPRPQVVTRAIQAGAQLGNTATGGALDFWFGADGELRGPFSYRLLHQHYWTHHLPSPLKTQPCSLLTDLVLGCPD